MTLTTTPLIPSTSGTGAGFGAGFGGRSSQIERCRVHGPRPSRPRGPRSVPVGRSGAARPARRRRLVAGVIGAVLAASSIVLAHDVLAGSSGLPASASSSRSAPHSVVTAQPGDSLWLIAERHRGDVAVERYVDLLVRLNGGPSIVAGQVVLLP